MVGRVHGGHRDGLVDLVEHLVDAMFGTMGLRMLFCADDDPVHGLDRFDGIGTRRGFGGEHHGVGAIKHCVGNVEHFCTSRH
ncbi:hypothetical protein D3C85_1748780 [compost metagenome]